MKSSLVYIIGGIVLFLGIVLSVVAFSLSGFNFRNLNNEPKFTEMNFISNDTVNTINAKDENVSIEIITSDDDKVHITYFENASSIYTIKENNGVINLSVDKTFNITGIFSFSFESVKLTIAIPENYDGVLNIETSNATITIEDVKASDVTLKTSNATIEVDNLVALGEIEIDTSNGKVDLENTSGNDFIIETSNAKIELNNVFSAEGLDLHTSNGSISFDDIKFVTEFRCKTSNASVDGTLPGNISDYSITSDTSNGNNSLPENMNSGGKKLNVKTSNGSIDIDFEE